MTRRIVAASEIDPGSSMARVVASAEKHGLAITICRMAQSTRTAAEAAEACGCDVGQIVKSLVFENAATGRLLLMLVSGAHNADMDHIASQYNLGFRRCDARRVRDETGFAIGGVAPIGHLTKLPVFMDRALVSHDVVWAAAGRPDSVFSVKPRALAEAIGATLIDVKPAQD